MSIKLKIRNRIFNIAIGYETEWFSQISLITIVEEFYVGRELTFAKVVWST